MRAASQYAQSTAYLNKRQLEMEVYAGADGTFNLVEDDGTTESHRVAGAKSVTALTYTDAATRTTIRLPQCTYIGAPAARRYVVRVHGLAAPIGMRVNGGATLPSYMAPGPGAKALSFDPSRAARVSS